MNPSKLTKRLILQVQTVTKDSYGQPINTWNNIATVWSSIEPLIGREFYAAQQINSEVTTKITIRYRAGIKSSMQAVYNSKTYDILSVIDVKEEHVEMQLMCKELI